MKIYKCLAPTRAEALQVTLAVWGEICEFVPRKNFGGGVYLDDKGNPTKDNTNQIGVIVIKSGGEQQLVPQGHWLLKGADGAFFTMSHEMFREIYR